MEIKAKEGGVAEGEAAAAGALTRSEAVSGQTGVLVASGKQATALMYSFKSRGSNWFTSP